MLSLPPVPVRARAVLSWWLAGLLAAGCGGGVDSGGTGAQPTSFASGPITGFGSVIVNTVHYDDRAATVRDGSGALRSRDDLRLGMTIDVRGSAIGIDTGGRPASTASSIVFASEIVGPVAVNDVAGRALTVLGQAIDVGASTVFAESLAGGQSGIVPGTVVEIYGRLDVATGRYSATRVEAKPAGTPFVVRGIVSGLDAGARSFAFGNLRISYLGLGSVPSTLANGSFVRATLAPVPGAGGIWPAIGLVDGAPAIADHDEAKLEGRVSAFVSETSFSVNGTPVDARTARMEGPRPTLGARVKAEGTISGGVLVASRVKVEDEDDEEGESFEVEGPVAALDTSARTFVVREVTVSYSGSVEFRNGTVADLAVGRKVEARGRLTADGTRLQAERIEFED